MEAESSLPPPVEVLEQIFDYLAHTEKLISRLVCKEWNNEISSNLTKTSRYVLACRKSNLIVLDSIVKWTNIRMSDYESSALTHTFRNRITTLQLDLSGFPDHSTTWKILLTELPNVKSLHFNIDDDEPVHDEFEQKPSLTQTEEFQLKRVSQKLENLSITFPFDNYTTLKYIISTLRPFSHETGSLTKLVIRETWTPKPESSVPAVGLLFELLVYDIIKSSRHSLKYLELDFYSQAIRSQLVPELVPQLCKMEGLKLESVLIHHEPIQEHVDRDFTLLHEFIRSQASSGVLKNIILPWSPNTSLCQELVESLPRDIESVGNVRKEHITQEFSSHFKKLKWFSVGGLIEEETFNQECCQVQVLQANVRKYGFSFDNQGEGRFHHVMTVIFPNLTTLEVIGDGGSSFVDQDLQNIINKLKKLRVLHIETCGITDFGVTGAEEDDSHIQELVTTGRLYLFTTPLSSTKQNELNYLTPLSSLENLEKLVLVGTQLTDAGIVLGFRFGSKLKQLTLGSESDKVSDLGLHCLGANSPGLEAFQGSFKSPKISTTGIGEFKEQLPLIKATQQFKVVNMGHNCE